MGPSGQRSGRPTWQPTGQPCSKYLLHIVLLLIGPLLSQFHVPNVSMVKSQVLPDLLDVAPVLQVNTRMIKV